MDLSALSTSHAALSTDDYPLLTFSAPRYTYDKRARPYDTLFALLETRSEIQDRSPADGLVDRALAHAQEAVELAASTERRLQEGHALRILGDVLGQVSGVERAEATYRRALALAEAQEMQPLQARCQLGLGRLYRRQGRVDEAGASLTAASRLLRALGMLRWVTDAEAELAELSPAGTTLERGGQ